MNDKLKKQFQGSIIGMAIGDALGYPLEFVQNIEGLHAITGGKPSMPTPALYSDDTQMSICVTEALIESKGDIDLFMDRLCDRFVGWFKTQIEGSSDHRSPGASCLAGCQNLSVGIPWLESGVRSRGCGSVVRSTPIGLYHHKDMLKVIEWAKDSSMPTHNDDTASASAVAVALFINYAMCDVPTGVWGHELRMPLEGISNTLLDTVQISMKAVADNVDPTIALSNDMIGEAWLAHEAVGSALYCCLRHQDDFAAAVSTAANTVGDSDSIACITGAIMGAKLGIDAIPEKWVACIENSDKLLLLADNLYGASTLI